MTQRFLICPCMGLSDDDAQKVGSAIGHEMSVSKSYLCGPDQAGAVAALSGPEAIWCCSQDPAVVEALAHELDRPEPALLNVRERAGWAAGQDAPIAKIAALMAEAAMPAEAAKTIDIMSDGLCLILGPADVTVPAAEQLAPYLSVTVLLDPGEALPDARGYEVIFGTLRQARGALGQFEVRIDALQQLAPGVAASLTAPKDGARSDCDILLDLRGETPLFPAHEKREGYVRADPRHAPAVAAAIFAASHLTGTFEKPLYVKAEPILCAHTRAGQTGCTRCLDLCPTGAILPDGDYVTIDPMICAGCGACSAACPSGAISYDAPTVESVIARVQLLAKTARAAGCTAPQLLAHDGHGAEMIRLAARHGAGLPAHVIPIALPAIGAFGHAEILAAAAAGFAAVSLLPGPGADRQALEAQVAMSDLLSGAVPIEILDTPDPDALSAAFTRRSASDAAPIRPLGTRRQIARQAARALNPEVEKIALPMVAPYGAVAVDAEACTLCLACVSLCPSGALGDNADKPQLRFQEDACLQCGLCVQICPEDALSLAPQLDLTEGALSQRVLNEEEPFACISCGTPFGSKATIDRISQRLSGHAMFADPSRLDLIKMCDDCRVTAQMHSAGSPFAGEARPRPRTTDDYLSARRDN